MNRLFRLLKVSPVEESKSFVSFILLRFFATCLITNTHYGKVYPISSFAVGGLIGDGLFFLISGFCLAKPSQESFFEWWGRRVLRIYPTIFVITIFYQIIGVMRVETGLVEMFSAYFLSSYFIFTTTIIFLYIPFYFINKISSKKKFLIVFSGWLFLWLFTYIFILDKSQYHMNNTYHYMILFLYFTAMMLGLYLRKFSSPKKAGIYMCLSLLFFAMNLLGNNKIRSNAALYNLQILVPLTLILAIYTLAYGLYALENKLKKLPKLILNPVNFIASITLEIYVVQRPIINALNGIIFPINWILITTLIVLAAVLLRMVVSLLEIGIISLFKNSEEGMKA